MKELRDYYGVFNTEIISRQAENIPLPYHHRFSQDGTQLEISGGDYTVTN